MATDLAASAMEAKGVSDYETLGVIKGSELEYMKTQHPFIDRTSLVIVGDHVTLESGTGCVHTAPGHGIEDFVVCKIILKFLLLFLLTLRAGSLRKQVCLQA